MARRDSPARGRASRGRARELAVDRDEAVRDTAELSRKGPPSAVVDCLNRMRPELPQFVEDPNAVGQVRVFHTNGWVGQRQTGGHWGGDLPSAVGHETLERVKGMLVEDGWDLSAGQTKILILTHRLLASEQGYRFSMASSSTSRQSVANERGSPIRAPLDN